MATEQTAPLPPDALTMIARALDKLSEQKGSGDVSPEQMQAMMSVAAAAAASQGAESMRQVLHPQNAQHPGKSAFSYPEGDVERPRPVLRPKADGMPGLVFFCGAREDPEQLTPAQIELYNRFDRTRTSREGRWRAEVMASGDLAVWVPCKSIDDRMDLPSLDLILTELLDGAAAVDPVSLAARLAQLEAQLAAK